MTEQSDKPLLLNFTGVVVKHADEYRSKALVNQDYDRARVVLDLQFPEHYGLFRKLKQLISS